VSLAIAELLEAAASAGDAYRDPDFAFGEEAEFLSYCLGNGKDGAGAIYSNVAAEAVRGISRLRRVGLVRRLGGGGAAGYR
jgi:hypothetical protein